MSPWYAGFTGSAAKASASWRVRNQALSVPVLRLQCSVSIWFAFLMFAAERHRPLAVGSFLGSYGFFVAAKSFGPFPDESSV